MVGPQPIARTLLRIGAASIIASPRRTTLRKSLAPPSTLAACGPTKCRVRQVSAARYRLPRTRAGSYGTGPTVTSPHSSLAPVDRCAAIPTCSEHDYAGVVGRPNIRGPWWATRLGPRSPLAAPRAVRLDGPEAIPAA